MIVGEHDADRCGEGCGRGGSIGESLRQCLRNMQVCSHGPKLAPVLGPSLPVKHANRLRMSTDAPRARYFRG